MQAGDHAIPLGAVRLAELSVRPARPHDQTWDRSAGDWAWLTRLLLAALLAFVIRPLLVGPLLWPVRLRRARAAVHPVAGLEGAVPILLGTADRALRERPGPDASTRSSSWWWRSPSWSRAAQYLFLPAG